MQSPFEDASRLATCVFRAAGFHLDTDSMSLCRYQLIFLRAIFEVRPASWAVAQPPRTRRRKRYAGNAKRFVWTTSPCLHDIVIVDELSARPLREPMRSRGRGGTVLIAVSDFTLSEDTSRPGRHRPRQEDGPDPLSTERGQTRRWTITSSMRDYFVVVVSIRRAARRLSHRLRTSRGIGHANENRPT